MRAHRISPSLGVVVRTKPWHQWSAGNDEVRSEPRSGQSWWSVAARPTLNNLPLFTASFLDAAASVRLCRLTLNTCCGRFLIMVFLFKHLHEFNIVCDLSCNVSSHGVAVLRHYSVLFLFQLLSYCFYFYVLAFYCLIVLFLFFVLIFIFAFYFIIILFYYHIAFIYFCAFHCLIIFHMWPWTTKAVIFFFLLRFIHLKAE